MEGVFINEPNIDANGSNLVEDGIKLLARCADMEVMTQTVIKNAVVWLCPADDNETLEFFFIHSGSLELQLEEGTVLLQAGDSFSLHGLRREILCKSTEDTFLLYISNRPMFEEAHDFETYLKKLINDIDEKDHYTCNHSANVMRYSTALYEAMYTGEAKSEALLNDLIIAALFHDVGKCYTPDEILKKKAKLDAAERKVICHHPIHSARLLRQHYNERVAEIAEYHHERMDGSGYPFGLTGDQISPEAKILAVVDAFDAMTTDRGYNEVKSFEEAADELCSMSDKFDCHVTETLRNLVRNGTIVAEKAKL